MTSTQAKWTAGPWTICCGRCFTVGSSDHPVAKVTHGEWGDTWPSVRLVGGSLERRAEPFMDGCMYGNVPGEEARANLHLIAAAPKLYEALDTAFAILVRLAEQQRQERGGGVLEGPRCNTAEYLAYCDARTALAKARGETP